MNDLENASWDGACVLPLTSYWTGESAPAGRLCSASLLWSPDALCVRFVATQNEPLEISDAPEISKKTVGLWDRDVCEIFVAPNPRQPHKYFEFEAAPTGEWVDVGIEATAEGRINDWDYVSDMKVAAAIEKGRVIIAVGIPWKAFGKAPEKGETWLGNLFRCVGKGPDRGYLAWQPTRTPLPNFHVPSAFGELVFC